MATKKVKKVETPIDQRETFVSIQKSFAESEANVGEKLETLYQLQKADTAIDKILQLRGELPEEVETLEKEIAQFEETNGRILQFIDGMTQNIANCKQDIIDCDTMISKYQKQIENIANSREFDSLNKEIENQGLLRQIAEKHIGESKAKILEAKNDLEYNNDMISIRKADLEAKRSELENIASSTAKEEARLKAAREECAAKIDARTMSAYERIRASVKNHLAVVPVYNGNACGGCFNTIIPQRLVDIASGRKLVICEHCGRIIVSPEISQ
ncbi:MAG: hypothetical protein II720_06120 [Bacteroidales bacterium]|nr:hypothetical protein [Bacteroidales bacterium]